jgi:hypothetical protein
MDDEERYTRTRAAWKDLYETYVMSRQSFEAATANTRAARQRYREARQLREEDRTRRDQVRVFRPN